MLLQFIMDNEMNYRICDDEQEPCYECCNTVWDEVMQQSSGVYPIQVSQFVRMFYFDNNLFCGTSCLS